MQIIADASYENFVEDLKEAESLRQCRYGIYDAQFTLKDGQNRSKIVFFLWYAALLSLRWLSCCCVVVLLISLWPKISRADGLTGQLSPLNFSLNCFSSVGSVNSDETWNPKSVIKFLWCNFLKDYQQNMADLSKLLLVRGLWLYHLNIGVGIESIEI